MLNYYYGLLIILLISLVVTVINHHKCSVKKAKMNFYKIHEDEGRFLQSSNWAPIRIYIDYTFLDSQKLNPIWVTKLKEVMSKTVSVFQSLVMVKPITGKLKIDKCDESVIIGNDIVTKGINTDLIIIPLMDNEGGSDLMAYAYPCAFDSTSNRPLMGVIGWSNSTDFGKKNYFQYHTMTALHEMTHIFAFNSDLYSMFIDINGKPLGLENILTNKTVNGKSRQMIKTPKVLASASKHFGCKSLEGVELEDYGGESTAGSHWEARLMLGDFMIGQDYIDSFISEITLSLFEDSGWYKINYYTGGLFRFGKNRGCDFLNTKCVQQGKVKFRNEFCLIENGSTCSSSRTSKGYCVFYSKNETQVPVSPNMDYFNNTTGLEIADYCPVANYYNEGNTYLSNSCSTGLSYYPSALGEVISSDSLCLMSSLTPINDTSVKSYEGSLFSICYPISCNYLDRTYVVSIKNQNAKCPTFGGKVFVNGYDGYLNCADFNLICTQSNGKCYNAIDCVEKRISAVHPTYDYQYDDNTIFDNSIKLNSDLINHNNTYDSILPIEESDHNNYSGSSNFLVPCIFYFLAGIKLLF